MSRRTARLLGLYLRSRGLGWNALAAGILLLLATLILPGIEMVSPDDRDTLVDLMRIATLLPMVVGVLVAVSVGSPFEELDDRLADRLWPVRIAVHGTYAVVAGLGSWGAGRTIDLELGGLILLRNYGIFLGLTLLMMRFLLPSRAWIPAFLLGGSFAYAARYDAPIPWWAMSMRPAHEALPWIVGGAVLSIGFLATARASFRQRLD